MKVFGLMVIIGCLFVAELSQAQCSAGTRCLQLTEAYKTAVTPEEAERLRNDLKRLGVDEILRYCKETPKFEVTQYSAPFCGPNEKAHVLCKIKMELSCDFAGKYFDMTTTGQCKGGFDNCGTFSACAKDSSVDTVKQASFLSLDGTVPKTSSPQGVAR